MVARPVLPPSRGAPRFHTAYVSADNFFVYGIVRGESSSPDLLKYTAILKFFASAFFYTQFDTHRWAGDFASLFGANINYLP